MLTLLSVGAGGALALFGIGDLVITVLHPDRDGPLTRWLQRTTWRVVTRVPPRFRRRQVMAAGGPLAVLVTYAAWLTLHFVGFALVYLPFLDVAFVTMEEIDPLSGAVDALYASIGTATVLGLGDVVPTAPWARMLTVTQAAIGLASITVTVTYLLGVLDGFAERNRLALQLQTTTGDGDGVAVLERRLAVGDDLGLQRSVTGALRMLQMLSGDIGRFPMLTLYYRSTDPRLDPEDMLTRVGELTAALHVLAALPGRRHHRPTAEELDATLTHFMTVVAEQYFGDDLRRAIQDPEVDDTARGAIAAVRARLVAAVGAGPQGAHAAEVADESAARLLARTHAFVGYLERLRR